MASYLRPRRGKKSTAETQNIVLKRGEIFFEAPETGVGTGAGRIKIGDGTTAYTSLPYFYDYSSFMSDISTATVTFTETSSGDNAALLSIIASGARVNSMTAASKNLLTNLNNSASSIAPAYDPDQIYNTGAFVLYYGTLYKAVTDNVTGTWDSSKWSAVKIVNEMGSGGGGGGVASFILRNQTLTFDNLVATLTDSRISVTTLVECFYHDYSTAAAAGIIANVTSAGTITFTAASAPSGTIVVDILCINEAFDPSGGGGEGTVYQKTLTAGSTSISFISDSIDSDSCFDFYVDQVHATVAPTGYSVAGTMITITYPAQSSDMIVGVKVSKGVIVDG